MATYGTTDRCTGGTAIEDGHYDVYVVANAFDDNNTTFWESPNTACPHYAGYDFGAGVSWKISKVVIRPFGGGRGTNAFTINGSNNGVDYTQLYSGNCTDTESDQTSTFTMREFILLQVQ
ncbi:MAG: discoidin domain-containing protein [Ramlibacter sp.]